jgi:hypothetical protein
VTRVLLGSLLATLLGGLSVGLALLLASPGSTGIMQVLALLFLSVGAVLLLFGVGGLIVGVAARLFGR